MKNEIISRNIALIRKKNTKNTFLRKFSQNDFISIKMAYLHFFDAFYEFLVKIKKKVKKYFFSEL